MRSNIIERIFVDSRIFYGIRRKENDGEKKKKEKRENFNFFYYFSMVSIEPK